jgi:ribosomal protein S18 acetylase RimI-like enzyme
MAGPRLFERVPHEPGTCAALDLVESRGVSYRKAAIRPYRAEDESFLFSLARESFGERPAWSDSQTLGALETDTVFVAELEGKPAGYVAVEAVADALRIDQLFVSGLHEGEGVGRQLLEYAEGFAISKGAARLEVVVEDDNRRARDFYRGRGFVPTGEDLLELTLPQQ